MSAEGLAKPAAAAGLSLKAELERAEQLVAAVEYDRATKVLKAILKAHPKCSPALDMLAEIHLSNGEPEKAAELFMRSVKAAPAENSSKYMYLGQLHEGKAALKYFRKGVEITRAELDMAIQDLKNANLNDDVAALRRAVAELKLQLSNQLCSCAELFVTDLCDEADAEKNVENLLRQALESYPYNPEALYASANLRTIQERYDEGETMLLRCVSVLNSIASVFDTDIWRDLRELQLNDDDDDEDDEDEDDDEDAVNNNKDRPAGQRRSERQRKLQEQQQKQGSGEQQKLRNKMQKVDAAEKAAGLQNVDQIVQQAPELESAVSFQLRLNAAKLCIEYGKYELACAQLEYCLRSNDRFIEVWYLLGCCWFERKDLQTAFMYLTRAEQMLEHLKKHGGFDDDEDDENDAAAAASLQKPVREMLRKVSTLAKQAGLELHAPPLENPNLAAMLAGGYDAEDSAAVDDDDDDDEDEEDEDSEMEV